MLPEVEQYLKEKKKAQEIYERWYSKENRKRPHRPHNWYDNGPDAAMQRAAYNEWTTKFQAEANERDAVRRRRISEAWDTLGNTTGDPVIKWLTNHMGTWDNYEGYVTPFLGILPATREEMETLASESDWCSEFDDLLQEATDAGVVPPATTNPNAATELITWVAEQTDQYERKVRREIQAMVDKIVAKAVARALDEKAIADAQNQESIVTA